MKLRQLCSGRRFVTHYGKSPGFHNHWIFHVPQRGITIAKMERPALGILTWGLNIKRNGNSKVALLPLTIIKKGPHNASLCWY